MSNYDYEKRFIAFVDILGTKKMVKSPAEKGEKECSKMISAIKILLDAKEHSDAMAKYMQSRECAIFSDNIAISCIAEQQGGLWYLLVDVLHLQIGLISSGIISRGGVVLGKLYHKGNTIFGPALVDAVSLETSVAVYPRVVLTEQTRVLGASFPLDSNEKKYELEGIDDLLKRDFDGMYFVDYFKSALTELEDHEVEKYVYDLRGIIVQGCDGTGREMPEIIKYQWMKEIFNREFPTAAIK